jgi:hypothetical protein
MTAEAYLSSPSSVDTYASDAEKTMMDQFQGALDACIFGWRRGNEAVLLQSDIQHLFGDTLMEYFKYCLAQQVGQSITFTTVNNGSTTQTFVQMPKNEQARLQLEARSTNPPKANDRAVVGPKTTSAVKRKAPRPMNCWIIFRDAMHKKLKAENPHLTVQQICKSASSPHPFIFLTTDSDSLFTDLERPLSCRETTMASGCEVCERRASPPAPGVQVQPPKARREEKETVTQDEASGCHCH